MVVQRPFAGLATVVVAAMDESHTQIDALIARFYAAFDNRGARLPLAADLRAMFVEGANVKRASPDGIETWTVEEFIAPRVTLLQEGMLMEFHEWEVEAQTTLVRNFASRRSIYRKTGSMSGTDFQGGGTKLIQLCRVDSRWLITSILWEDDP